MTDQIALRPFTRDEYDAAMEAVGLSFFFAANAETRQMFADVLEFERTLAAFAGDRIVGTAGIFTFELSAPGALVPAAGVTLVTVHPAHRRRGILTAIMDRQLTDLHEGGEPIAVLRASEASIYGRFGYAAASRELSVELRRSEAALRSDDPPADGLELRLHQPDQVREQLAAVYDAARVDRPGFIGRVPAVWNDVLHDPESRRHGATPLRAVLVSAGDEARGYVLYRVQQRWVDGVPAARVNVDELVAADPAAAAALWRHVLDLDLTTTIDAGGRPLDDPLLHLLADPRRAKAQLVDGLWLRLVRLDEALAARRYAAPVDLVLEVTDARCPWNAGRWRLSGDGSGATCARSTDPVDLRLDTTVLAAGYLGDPVLAGYAAAGRVGEQRPGALRRLAAALGWAPAPWCPHHF